MITRYTWLFTAWRTGADKTARKALPLSHEVQKRPPCVLNSFSEETLDAVDPDLVPGLVICVDLKDYMCTICPWCHLSKISKFRCAYSQFTYWVSDPIRLPSASRSNLERYFCWRGGPGVQPLPCRKAQQAPGCSLFMECDDWLAVLFAYWLQMLVSSKLGWSWTLTSTVVRWAHCSS